MNQGFSHGVSVVHETDDLKCVIKTYLGNPSFKFNRLRRVVPCSSQKATCTEVLVYSGCRYVMLSSTIDKMQEEKYVVNFADFVKKFVK